MKKVGKITRPFRHDLNQIPYDYTVEVTNRFKGLDLIVPEELWTEAHDIVQEAMIKTILKKKKCKSIIKYRCSITLAGCSAQERRLHGARAVEGGL